MKMQSLPLEEQIKLIARIKKELQDQHTATLLNLTISGSHLYGWSSIDSDVDIRGIYIVNSNKFLGLNRPADEVHMSYGNIEIVLQEIGKMTDYALKSNCTMLEQIVAPSIYTTQEYLEWKPLALGKINKTGLYKSYKGMAMFNYSKFIKTGRKKTVKKYLYVYRALLSGVHALEAQVIQPNAVDLAKYYHVTSLKNLIKAKVNGIEEGELSKEFKEPDLDAEIVKWLGRIDLAYQKSTLPEKMSYADWKEMNEWIIKLRKKYMG